jgi:hypothetical protein
MRRCWCADYHISFQGSAAVRLYKCWARRVEIEQRTSAPFEVYFCAKRDRLDFSSCF